MIVRLMLVIAVIGSVISGIACVNDPTLDNRTSTDTATSAE